MGDWGIHRFLSGQPGLSAVGAMVKECVCVNKGPKNAIVSYRRYTNYDLMFTQTT